MCVSFVFPHHINLNSHGSYLCESIETDEDDDKLNRCAQQSIFSDQFNDVTTTFICNKINNFHFWFHGFWFNFRFSVALIPNRLEFIFSSIVYAFEQQNCIVFVLCDAKRDHLPFTSIVMDMNYLVVVVCSSFMCACICVAFVTADWFFRYRMKFITHSSFWAERRSSFVCVFCCIASRWSFVIQFESFIRCVPSFLSFAYLRRSCKQNSIPSFSFRRIENSIWFTD